MTLQWTIYVFNGLFRALYGGNLIFHFFVCLNESFAPPREEVVSVSLRECAFERVTRGSTTESLFVILFSKLSVLTN
jgi:hypothetical protein